MKSAQYLILINFRVGHENETIDWYLKVVNEAETMALVFIPKIALDENDKGHAFIQVLDGKKGTANPISLSQIPSSRILKDFRFQYTTINFRNKSFTLT